MFLINKGDRIIVISGKKLPIGTKGTCFWIGEKPWGVGVGIQLENGNKEFTALKNVAIYTNGKKLDALVKCIENNKVIEIGEEENIQVAVQKISEWGF